MLKGTSLALGGFAGVGCRLGSECRAELSRANPDWDASDVYERRSLQTSTFAKRASIQGSMHSRLGMLTN